jgi:hypothetical protein
MKYLKLSFLIAVLIAFSSCSNDDDFKTITPTSIAFVHEDGSPIAKNECINPNTRYAILIKTNSVGKGAFQDTKILYTLNGVLNIMTFTKDGQQLKVIQLNDGNNVAEIVESNFKASLYFNSQDNFELVL